MTILDDCVTQSIQNLPCLLSQPTAETSIRLPRPAIDELQCKAAKEGDQVVWAAIVDSNQRWMMARARFYLGQYAFASAEDCVQEVWLQLFKALQKWDSPKRIYRAYLGTMLRRCIIRKFATRSCILMNDRSMDTLVAMQASVMTRELRELECDILRYLARLTAGQRRVAELVIVHRKSLCETAKILGLTDAATRKAWSRAKQQLRGFGQCSYRLS